MWPEVRVALALLDEDDVRNAVAVASEGTMTENEKMSCPEHSPVSALDIHPAGPVTNSDGLQSRGNPTPRPPQDVKSS